MTERLTTTQLAKRWGISRQSLGNRTKEPGFPVDSSSGKPSFPWPEVNDWWQERCVRKAVLDSRPTDIDEAKRRKLLAEAELAEIERDRAVGKVVDADATERRWETVLLRVRAKIVARPAYEAPLLVGKNVKEIRAELTKYGEEILTELREDRTPMVDAA